MSFSAVRELSHALAGSLRTVPLVPYDAFRRRTGRRALLKIETLQPAGTFKIRGALASMLRLTDEQRASGVVAFSGGNFGLAVAEAAHRLRVSALVYMPASAQPSTVGTARQLGADVRVMPDIDAAIAAVDEAVAEGRALLHPFDSDAVVVANATIGLEIMQEAPAVTDIVLSVGGGGLLAGIASLAEWADWPVRLHAVEIEGAETLAGSLAAGEPIRIKPSSIAPALNSPYVSDTAFELASRRLETMTIVSASDAVEACFTLLDETKLLTEPAAGCTLAALERIEDDLPDDAQPALILCGGNVSLEDLRSLRADS